MDAKLVPVSGRIFQLLLGLFPHQLPVMPENKVLARVSKSDELPNPLIQRQAGYSTAYYDSGYDFRMIRRKCLSLRNKRSILYFQRRLH